MTTSIKSLADGLTSELQVNGNPVIRFGADTSGHLAGFRNLLINGNFNINQRAYVSGTNTTGSNQYTLDRWRIPVIGKNITFAASGNGNLVTIPFSNSIEQVIEGVNIAGGTYVINWEGTATCEVNSVPVTKGGTFTLTANTNATVEFISGTVGKAQLEAGSIATPFEHRPYGTELALCQRYYQSFFRPVLRGSATAAQLNRIGIVFPVSMRSAPTATVAGTHYWFDGVGTGTFTAIATAYTDSSSAEFDITPATGTPSAGRSTGTYKDPSSTGVLNFSSEL